MKLIKAGTYTAKVINYGIPEVEPGKHPKISIKFEFQADGVIENLWFYGSLHPNASDYTLKSLVNAGFRFENLEKLLEPDAFDGRECQIVVQHHEYNGRVSARIAWVNTPSKFKAMDPAQAKRSLSAFNNQLKLAKRELGGNTGVPDRLQDVPAPEFAPADDFDITGSGV